MATIDVPLPLGWSKLHVRIELEAPGPLATKRDADQTLDDWDSLIGVHWTESTIQYGNDPDFGEFWDVKATYIGGPEILNRSLN